VGRDIQRNLTVLFWSELFLAIEQSRHLPASTGSPAGHSPSLVTKGAQGTAEFEEPVALLAGARPWMPRIEITASRLLPRRHRPWRQAHQSDQRHRVAASSRPGLSPLPRPAGHERLAADNRPLGAAVSLRPKPRSASSHSISVCPAVPPRSLAWGGRYHTAFLAAN
jgi:hypothetical protein